MARRKRLRRPQSPTLGKDIEPLIEEAGEVAGLLSRAEAGVTRRERATVGLLGATFAGFALACAGEAHLWRDWQAAAMGVGTVLLFVLARRCEFVSAVASTVPTEPVLVAALFTGQVQLVPLLVLAGWGPRVSPVKEPGGRVHRVLSRWGSGWHCAGPVLVLWVTGLRTPSFAHWPVLVVALLSQFAFDGAFALARSAGIGASFRQLPKPMIFTWVVDATLAPIGACIVLATHGSLAALLFAGLPAALLWVLRADREEKLSTAVTLGKALRSVHDEARSDPMTGLANRRAWEEAVAVAEQALAGRPSGAQALPTQQPEAACAPAAAGTAQEELVVAVMMADLDHLKSVNDTYGHSAGDDLICTFAKVLTSVAPLGSVLARLGGDEFGMLWTAPLDQAAIVGDLAERLRNALRSCVAPWGVPLSASLGVAYCPPAPSVTEAIRLADTAAAVDKHSRQVQRGAVPDLAIIEPPPSVGPSTRKPATKSPATRA